jgi:uncharacterized protein (DUF1330 family)
MMKRTFFASALAACAMSLLPFDAAYAQSVPTAGPAYYVSEFELTNPEGIRPYSAAVESTFTPFGGRYVVRGGTVNSLEGDATKRIVMIAFPSLQQAQAWYDSPAYRAIRPIRQQSATTKAFIVEGLAN